MNKQKKEIPGLDLAISQSCDRSIILAADDISKLRAPDVQRVIEDFFFGYGSSQEIVDYISEHRPDLAAEAKACQLELVPGDIMIVIPPKS